MKSALQAGEAVALTVFSTLATSMCNFSLHGTPTRVCEAVSAKSDPTISSILQAEGNNVLRKLGFNQPETSPNYSQTINIKNVDDLGYAARLGFRVLKEAYRVADFGGGDVHVRIVRLLKLVEVQ